ncbi:MAG: ThiF family adenylyltransferase [Leptospiraceae bacterium]|nr:ThiF family adenylyltransferase [Leptospiraceae bacterium]
MFHEIFNRSILALGLDTMRHIMKDQTVTVVGVGGLGSVIAEHLVHTGFPKLNLIDFDRLEISNLNRIVGATYEEAKRGAFKVDAVKRHLVSINPGVQVSNYALDVNDKRVEEVIALSDWLIVATDSHSSRFKCQELSVKYFVPMISAGVNITVENGGIKDMSGEVITSRIGDNLCLNCLGRVNYIKVGQETHPDKFVSSELVKRGYVTGMDVKEPAVKTLNTFLGTMAVEVLVNQYTERQRHVPILVFESNGSMAIYEDRESVDARHKDCFTCNV